jgi:hypothetical protein
MAISTAKSIREPVPGGMLAWAITDLSRVLYPPDTDFSVNLRAICLSDANVSTFGCDPHGPRNLRVGIITLSNAPEDDMVPTAKQLDALWTALTRFREPDLCCYPCDQEISNEPEDWLRTEISGPDCTSWLYRPLVGHSI